MKHGTQKATANARKSKDNNDSDDDLGDIYEQVDNDDNDDSDSDNDDYEDMYDNDDNDNDDHDDSEASDLEELRNESYKNKGKKRPKHDNDDDDDGEIIRTTKKIIEKNKTKAKNNTSSSKKGPRMYEIADGVASNKGIFNYTNEEKQTRRKERALSQIPLKERISTSYDSTNSEIKTTRKDGLGIIREMSYMPKEVKKLKKDDNLINHPKANKRIKK